MCGERKEAYMFMCNFILTNTPMRPASSVHIVTGDGFFNQTMIEEFGFINAKYLKDWFHLFDSGLVDIFGETGNTLVKGDLVQMIKADSEEHFEKAYSNARLILRQQQPRNACQCRIFSI